jgi:uncharacterized protein YbaR (Trm112 family)
MVMAVRGYPALHWIRMKKLPIATVLGMLACPVCHAALLHRKQEDLQQEAVLCSGCGRRYPMHDRLPVLLAEAARQ